MGIDSFKLFKSPGPDGIFPAQLQHTISYILPWLKAIFAGWLKIKYMPQCWRFVKVMFILKAGKASHVTPKYFCPISLSSFLLKTFERLLEVYMKAAISSSLLLDSQLASRKESQRKQHLTLQFHALNDHLIGKNSRCQHCFSRFSRFV